LLTAKRWLSVVDAVAAGVDEEALVAQVVECHAAAEAAK
jgi:hypothetical protein